MASWIRWTRLMNESKSTSRGCGSSNSSDHNDGPNRKSSFFSIRILDLVLFGKKVSGHKTGSQFFLVLLMGGYRLTSFSRQKIH
jgi:hypothetical protein